MGNTNSQIKQNIEEGIPLIKEWIETKREIFKENDNFNELIRVINEIEKDNDFSFTAFEDIRYLLRPFEYIPLQIKRIFNISTLDNYTIFIASRHFKCIEDYINLELCSKRFNGNMTKFFYNPIPLTNTTRELFPNLQTIYIYSTKGNQFIDDKRILKREFCKIQKYDLFHNQKEQLEYWTGLTCNEVLFDSEKDNWSINTSVLNERIIGKKQLVFLIEDTDGEKFGYYLCTEITEIYEETHKTHWKSFHFNLQSNGRLSFPMKFEIKDPWNGGYRLFNKTDDNLIGLGNIWLYKENKKNLSYCWQNEDIFYYYAIEKAVCGKTGGYPNYNCFTPKRLLVIQMK